MYSRNLPSLLRTARAIGFRNLARVVAFRAGLRSGLHRVLRVVPERIVPPVFHPPQAPAPEGAVARTNWDAEAKLFGSIRLECGEPPDWHRSVVTGRRSRDDEWFRLSDFDADLGDIKGVWELSRCDWAIAFAQRAALGHEAAFARLSHWLADWLEKVPPYRGANWKCGQEASIRVLHFLAAAIVLGQDGEPAEGLLKLVEVHLRRIAPTIAYAVGQDNNHGTSEAAALFCGGSLLASAGVASGEGWCRLGRKWLEDRVRHLIATDGSFSQHSVVYHRMMLNTLSFSETWRRRRDLPPFSDTFLDRARKATWWLRQFVDLQSGEAPNYGANDSSHILAMCDAGSRDFRPSLQWAAAVFCERRAVEGDGPYNQQLRWLGISVPEAVLAAPQRETFDAGGTHVLRAGTAVAYLNYPRFRFRPSQADALHCDLWVAGENILPDAGSFSYNSTEEDLVYFSGTASHNTIQFDQRDQMERLGRFLFADWLKTSEVEPVCQRDDRVTAAAAYRDRQGVSHFRKLTLAGDRLICEDRISGPARQGILRWRCKPGPWRLCGTTLSDGRRTISISSDDPAMAVALKCGEVSHHYASRTSLPVLEIALACPAQVTSEIVFA